MLHVQLFKAQGHVHMRFKASSMTMSAQGGDGSMQHILPSH